MNKPFLKSINLQGFLSYKESQEVKMENLNIIIGPNGSGKSNLIQAINLLRHAPKDLGVPIRAGGGVRDWLWKGGKASGETAKVEAIFENSKNSIPLRYVLEFTHSNGQFSITRERIESERPYPDNKEPSLFYDFNGGQATLNTIDESHREGAMILTSLILGDLGIDKSRHIRIEKINPQQSILSQRKDPDSYPELTYLGDELSKIRLYREWSFGPHTTVRMPQKTDLPNIYLEPDASNLGLVLNYLQRNPPVKKALLNALQDLYEGIDDYYIEIQGGTVQVFLQEGDYLIPATRLSDGTLRYLCLLAILFNPSPPPLVCIEEPELGLHPDMLPKIAELLKDASNRCQLIVTTHSDILVDAMSDQPESILVAEKVDGGTKLSRLDPHELKPWLEDYRLGELWIRGDIGGNRW